MLKILPLPNAYHILGCDPYENAKVLFVEAVFIIFLASLTYFLVWHCKYLRERLVDYDKLPVSAENHYDWNNKTVYTNLQHISSLTIKEEVQNVRLVI